MSDQGDFMFSVPSHLGNDLVELVPFEVAKHAELMIAGVSEHPELFKWLPYPHYTSLAEFNAFYHARIVTDDSSFIFVIKDKLRDSGPNVVGEVNAQNIAGVIALINCSVAAAQGEVGHVMILPRSQRSHVLTNAAGLLMEYALNRPEEGGLGLRRLQWQANTENEGSRAAALRLGFKFEGILRWHRILPQGKIGPWTRDEDGRGPGRHTAMFACCFDDWEGGEKEAIKQKMMLRKKDERKGQIAP